MDSIRYIDIVNFPPTKAGDIVFSEDSVTIARFAIFEATQKEEQGMLHKLGENVSLAVKESVETVNTRSIHLGHLIAELEQMCSGDFPRAFVLGAYSVDKPLLEGVTV
jgi:hypothetical protein